jgi:iron(III) transport system substrate-binding protein
MRYLFYVVYLVVALATLLSSAHASAQTAPKGGAQQEWEQVVAAAKKEGEVHIIGPAGTKLRDALAEPFAKKYGVRVEYLSAGGFQIPQRVERERQAGVFSWDLFIAGTTTLVKGLRPIGALDPIEPALILNEVKDRKVWRGGEPPFFDKERVGLSVLLGAGQYLFINTQLARADEFRSWRDLLNPKWKGKIVMGRDPRTSGYGNATFKFFFTDKSLGPGYIRELVKQELTLLRDDRVAAQWLAQGKFPICICSDIDTVRLIDQGLPIAVIDGRQLKEGTHVTSAYGNVALANRAPHPNVAKVYINWILSREGSTLFSQASGMPSVRVDVPTDHVRPATIPEPGWHISSTEEGLAQEEPLAAFLKQVMGE